MANGERSERFKTSADREQVAEVAPQYRGALDDSLVEDLEERAILKAARHPNAETGLQPGARPPRRARGASPYT